jgi:sulfite exporter TauE/SafE
MGYLVGLLTSLHCIAMCGGIVLSQGLARKEGETRSAPVRTASGLLERLRPSLLYNGGRIVSYTLIGGIVGVLGSLFSLSTAVLQTMQVYALGTGSFLAGAFSSSRRTPCS